MRKKKGERGSHDGGQMSGKFSKKHHGGNNNKNSEKLSRPHKDD